MFVAAQLHDVDLVLLAFLLQILDLSIAITQHLPAFTNLALKAATLILETNGHLANFSVDHGFSLTFHHISQFLQLLALALLSRLVASLPLIDLS